jgi:hypothetical protein
LKAGRRGQGMSSLGHIFQLTLNPSLKKRGTYTTFFISDR